nr:site-specific integrase [Marivita hallyeonensis]
MIPKLGNMHGSEITARDVSDALKPIWRTKHPTAEKAIQRTRIVLRSAKRMGFPTDPDVVDSAQEILGIVNHVVEHSAHVPWLDIPDLYSNLPNTVAGACNRWLILTGTRMMAGRGARVPEVADDVWTVPADRMKGKEGLVADFRVPLSEPAMEIVERAREFGQDHIFPSLRGHGPITDAAVEKCLRQMKVGGTPHGFRTSFRTWAQDMGVSFDVAEAVLSHTVGNKVTRAYARSDLLDQRRIVMDAWARFVTGQETVQLQRDGNVIPMQPH